MALLISSMGKPSKVSVLIMKELVMIFSEGFFNFSIEKLILPGLDTANSIELGKVIVFFFLSTMQVSSVGSTPDKP